MSLLIVVSVILTFVAQTSLSLNNTGSELLLVHIIFRHGARTTYMSYPNDPYINETYYPYGLGALTNEGKRMEYTLGQYFREYYNDFLSEDYQESEVYIRSTDEIRTRASGQLVMAGMLPPTGNLTWNDQLLWLPIPVDYLTRKNEDLFHVRNCDRKMQIYRDMFSDPYVQERYMKPYQDLYDKIQNYSGAVIRNPVEAEDFFFILQTQDEQNFTLPQWTKEIYPEPLHRVSALVYEYLNYHPEMKIFNAGYLLKHILGNCKQKINGCIKPSKRKLVLFSGHETTIGFMLDLLLNETQTMLPPYSSALAFELHKMDEKHYIKMKYKNGTYGAEFADLPIPDCDVMCPFQKFYDLYSFVFPKVSMEEWCRLKLDEGSTTQTAKQCEL